MEDKADYKLSRFDQLPEGASESFKKMAEKIYALFVGLSKTYASDLIINAALVALTNFLAQTYPPRSTKRGIRRNNHKKH